MSEMLTVCGFKLNIILARPERETTGEISRDQATCFSSVALSAATWFGLGLELDLRLGLG